MKHHLIFILTLFLFTTPLTWGFAAGSNATRQDCMTLVKKAAQMIEKEGLAPTLAKINDRKGPFIVKDTYVFCLTSDTVKMVGHPYAPEPWRALSHEDFLDPHGTLIFQKFIKTLEDKDEAWVDYVQYRRQGEKPSKRTSYIMKVPGTNLIVGAGIFE